MSKATKRNYSAIAKLNKQKNLLIAIVSKLNKLIGKKKQLSQLFKMKNKYFNKLCKVQDCLKLELKLFDIVTKLNNQYLDYFNNYTSVRKYAENNNISLLKTNIIINLGRKINHSGV